MVRVLLLQCLVVQVLSEHVSHQIHSGKVNSSWKNLLLCCRGQQTFSVERVHMLGLAGQRAKWKILCGYLLKGTERSGRAPPCWPGAGLPELWAHFHASAWLPPAGDILRTRAAGPLGVISSWAVGWRRGDLLSNQLPSGLAAAKSRVSNMQMAASVHLGRQQDTIGHVDRR